MDDKSSPHILNTSANLLGFSFLVLSSIKSLGLAPKTIIDEIISLCIILFAVSSYLSFASIHTRKEKRSVIYELIAEYVFLAGLSIITVVSILLAFDIILLGK